MKNLAVIAILAAVFFVLAPAQAQAQEYGFYLTPKAFWSHVKADVKHSGSGSDNVGGGALAIGYDFNVNCYAPVRAELEFAMRGKAKKSWRESGEGYRAKGEAKADVTSIFANAYYDFYNQSDFTPYLGAGLGAARIKIETKGSYAWSGGVARESYSKSEWDFAWNVGAGVAYKLTEQASLDLGYRYADFGSLSDNSVDVDVTGHEVLLGLRFTF